MDDFWGLGSQFASPDLYNFARSSYPHAYQVKKYPCTLTFGISATSVTILDTTDCCFCMHRTHFDGKALSIGTPKSSTILPDLQGPQARIMLIIRHPGVISIALTHSLSLSVHSKRHIGSSDLTCTSLILDTSTCASCQAFNTTRWDHDLGT